MMSSSRRERLGTPRYTAGMRCISCREVYEPSDAGTCKECYEEASETEEELKREIEDLKSKISFLKIWSPLEPIHHQNHRFSSSSSSFTDIVLEASDDDCGTGAPSIRAHKAVLISKSPVFKAMLENEMEESRSGIIKISEVSYDVLRSFVHYLYTAEVSLDEVMALELLVLAEKYQVKHLKSFCEKFMTSKVNSENAMMSFAFAHRHNAKNLLEASLSLITDNMFEQVDRDEYKELVDENPRLVVEIYEAYLAKQTNPNVIQ
ncbi:BTB/POZ domain-containing protein [Cinnamomum micranthum f. kanehirae]|uniref:BTB/POZ domain-containing protein n=1 Tax=Cinnamomum micranthum f. kanehirae TaxID=337451 RepID=A0A3S3N8E7_9MAGN|nr:BTB/POZ domain-containing protein [Cinnamomum micranthum f. kanehirae]